MTENELSYIIRGAAFQVHKELGPGLLESIYEAALYHVLMEQEMMVLRQKALPVTFRGNDLGIGLRLDLLVGGKVIVEIKSVENLALVHFKQLLTYLKLSDLKLGLLINFNEAPLRIERMVNKL